MPKIQITEKKRETKYTNKWEDSNTATNVNIKNRNVRRKRKDKWRISKDQETVLIVSEGYMKVIYGSVSQVPPVT